MSKHLRGGYHGPKAGPVQITHADGTTELAPALRHAQLAGLQRQADRRDPAVPPWPIATHDLTCATCHGLVTAGQRIRYSGYEQRLTHHHRCPEPDG